MASSSFAARPNELFANHILDLAECRVVACVKEGGDLFCRKVFGNGSVKNGDEQGLLALAGRGPGMLVRKGNPSHHGGVLGLALQNGFVHLREEPQNPFGKVPVAGLRPVQNAEVLVAVLEDLCI